MPGGRRRRPSSTGQHLLADRRLAADLVRNAGVTSGDLVLEIGAGTGVLTSALAETAGRVRAIELDGRFVRTLRDRFADAGRVEIVEADALRVPLPREPYRVVANIPFGHTTDILRRLLDPRGPLLRADLVVQWGAAIKRARQRPGTLLTMSWTPWFELTVSRRIPARRFRPPPSVDAGVLTVTRRPDPLLDPGERRGFVRLLEVGFSRASEPVVVSLRGVVPPKRLKGAVRDLGLPRGTRALDLDVAQWVRIHRSR